MLERSATSYPGTAPSGTTCVGGTRNDYRNPVTHLLTRYTEATDCNYVVFGNFNNAVNDADVQNFAEANPTTKPWNIYNENTNRPLTYGTIVIITSPNKTLATNLKNSYPGSNPNTIFQEAMPAYLSSGESAATTPVVNACNGPVRPTMMNQQACDVYTTLVRFTLAKSSADQTTWSNGTNVLAFRVTSTASYSNSDLYDAGVVQNGNPMTMQPGVYAQSYNTNETNYPNSPCPTGGPWTLPCSTSDIASVLRTWASNSTSHTYGMFQASGMNDTMNTNGGVGQGILNGTNTAGATQDNNFYRSIQGGALQDVNPTMMVTYPVFAVGVVHSSSSMDFTSPTPSYNADYTGISIADDATANLNWGVADAANPNSLTQFTIPEPNDFLLGSAYTVLNTLNINGVKLINLINQNDLPDLNDLYIHIFYRNDSYGGPNQTVCGSNDVCQNALVNDATVVVNPQGTVPIPQTPINPPEIPDLDGTLYTERGYRLPPPAGTTLGSGIPTQYLTGASVQYLSSPWIVCDTIDPNCGAAPNGGGQ
jgi:hypothetical protein